MTRLSRDDSGQITTAVVIVGIVAVVWLGLAVVKLGQAVDVRSHFQTAADAAALAGAQEIRTKIPGLVRTSIEGTGAGSFMSPGCSELGVDAARDFALRAGADVWEYCYDASTDTVRVTVEGRADSVVTGSSVKAKATAQAELGRTLGDCQLPVSTDTPTGTPSTPATPPVTSTPPPPADIRCGELPITMTPGPSGRDRIKMSDSEIRESFNPRLKS